MDIHFADKGGSADVDVRNFCYKKKIKISTWTRGEGVEAVRTRGRMVDLFSILWGRILWTKVEH